MKDAKKDAPAAKPAAKPAPKKIEPVKKAEPKVAPKPKAKKKEVAKPKKKKAKKKAKKKSSKKKRAKKRKSKKSKKVEDKSFIDEVADYKVFSGAFWGETFDSVADFEIPEGTEVATKKKTYDDYVIYRNEKGEYIFAGVPEVSKSKVEKDTGDVFLEDLQSFGDAFVASTEKLFEGVTSADTYVDAADYFSELPVAVFGAVSQATSYVFDYDIDFSLPEREEKDVAEEEFGDGKVDEAFEGLQDFGKSIVTGISGFAGFVFENVADAAGAVGEGVASGVQTVGEGIASGVKSAGDAVKDATTSDAAPVESVKEEEVSQELKKVVDEENKKAKKDSIKKEFEALDKELKELEVKEKPAPIMPKKKPVAKPIVEEPKAAPKSAPKPAVAPKEEGLPKLPAERKDELVITPKKEGEAGAIQLKKWEEIDIDEPIIFDLNEKPEAVITPKLDAEPAEAEAPKEFEVENYEVQGGLRDGSAGKARVIKIVPPAESGVKKFQGDSRYEERRRRQQQQLGY